MKSIANGSTTSIEAGRLLFSGPTTDGNYGVYIMLAVEPGRSQGTLPGKTRTTRAAFAKWKF